MRKKLFVPALLVVLALTALVATGCGSGVPSDSVATVDGTPIKKSEFEHWLSVASKQQAASGQSAVVPDPPNYTKCVAALQKVPLAKGQAKPSPDALKAQCQQQYEGLKQQVMQFLVQSEWLLKEADSRKLKAAPATVQKQLDDQIKQSFPKRTDFDKFLQQSGMTMNDLLFRVKIDVLTQQVGRRSWRAGTRSRTPRSRRTTPRTRPASPSPSGATSRSCSRRPRTRPTRPRPRSTVARRGARWRRSTRSTRRRSRRAASSPAWPRVSRRRRSTTRSSAPTRARSSAR